MKSQQWFITKMLNAGIDYFKFNDLKDGIIQIIFTKTISQDDIKTMQYIFRDCDLYKTYNSFCIDLKIQ